MASLAGRFARQMAGALLGALALGLALPAALAQESPRRVVSISLCTDQLAMLMATPGQLHSVSYLAADPTTSVLAEHAGGYVLNHGRSEEVFLMKPDLVVASAHTSGETVALLRRLGFRVEEFSYETSFDDVRANLERMGHVLGRQQRARELVADLDAGLQQLRDRQAEPRTAAFYYANSYTSGTGTLADAIVKAAGLINISDRLGLHGFARLPLELLILAQPDLIVTGHDDYNAPALAQQNFAHPAYRALTGRLVALPEKYTMCGAPFTLEAVRILQEAAAEPGGRTP